MPAFLPRRSVSAGAVWLAGGAVAGLGAPAAFAQTAANAGGANGGAAHAGTTHGAAVPPPATSLSAPLSSTAATQAEWEAFKRNYVQLDGRVVDTGNGGISHTEGQGYGMYFAFRHNDAECFARMVAWTNATLRRPHDMLHAWRYRPNATVPVDDMNNATDGDILIAWSLVLAGTHWNEPRYLRQGVGIARDILRLLSRRAGGHMVLLPALSGFETPESVVINPSYYIFPALRDLSLALPNPAWVRITGDGLRLLRRARYGQWGLPPDWLQVARSNASLSLPRNWPPRFSFDAVRVPLYMTWAQLGAEPSARDASNFWQTAPGRFMPAWTDLTTNALSPYAASVGMQAVAALVGAERPVPESTPDYYSSALGLLAHIAAGDVA